METSVGKKKKGMNGGSAQVLAGQIQTNGSSNSAESPAVIGCKSEQVDEADHGRSRAINEMNKMEQVWTFLGPGLRPTQTHTHHCQARTPFA